MVFELASVLPAAALPNARLSELLQQPVWDEEALSAAGIKLADSYFMSVGGGLGSFAVVDFLRIAGVGTQRIRVLSKQSAPHESFAALVHASQLKPEDRLRSDSSARINNIWGWPGYALSEAIAERTLKPLLKVLIEPFLCEHFTPRVRTVLAGLEREAVRIGWNEMLVRCEAEVVRRRTDGGYFVLVRSLDNGGGLVAYRCQHVHLALGHSGPRLLPDVVAFRKRYGCGRQVVNGYEPHEHVYEHLIRSPGEVVLRGAGITASRILERLIDDRDRFGLQTRILHIFRSYVDGSKGPPWFRRRGGHGFAYQPFNFPKAAGGGQLRQQMLTASEEERVQLIRSMGGTTTAFRKDWQRQLARGRREGWYRVDMGLVTDIRLKQSGKLGLTLCRAQDSAGEVVADFLIDATGLEDSVHGHPLLSDLLENGGASVNALGGLDVEPSFEVRGARSGGGKIYASGIATMGGALAPVDSFWGLTHAAMEICSDLDGQGSCEFPGALRSISQWWNWVRNQQP
jgi:hypothetical protein